MSSTDVLFFIAFFIFLLFGICLFIFKQRRPLSVLMEQLEGKINVWGAGVFQYQGKDILIRHIPGSKNRAPELRVLIEGNFGAQLLIRRQTAYDVFYKQIGLNRELDIADREEKDRLYFECDDQEFLNQLLVHNDMKEELFRLLEYYSDIQITSKKCLFRKYPAADSVSKDDILPMAHDLVNFTSEIPATGGNHPELVLFKIKRFILYALGALTLAVGVSSFIVAGNYYKVVDSARLWAWSAHYALVICLVVMAVVFFIIRGFSTSSKVFVFMLWAFCIGIFLIGRYGLAIYNGVYDAAAAEAFDQQVADKYTTHHKSSTYYHVELEPWRSGMSYWDIEVSYSEYYAIVPHYTKYRVWTKKGSLGYEWVVGEQRLPATA